MELDEFEPVYGEETDFDGEDVAVMRDDEGRASIVPRSMRKLPAELRAEVRSLIEAAAAVYESQAAVDEHVADLRQAGVSWSLIGWAVGTTGEAARQRWGDA